MQSKHYELFHIILNSLICFGWVWEVLRCLRRPVRQCQSSCKMYEKPWGHRRLSRYKPLKSRVSSPTRRWSRFRKRRRRKFGSLVLGSARKGHMAQVSYRFFYALHSRFAMLAYTTYIFYCFSRLCNVVLYCRASLQFSLFRVRLLGGVFASLNALFFWMRTF